MLNKCIRRYFFPLEAKKQRSKKRKNNKKKSPDLRLPSSPLRDTAGHLPALSVPGVGHLQILRCPGVGHSPTPGPFPSFCHARGFLSEDNYTDDFTGKESRLICRLHFRRLPGPVFDPPRREGLFRGDECGLIFQNSGW